MKSRENHNFLKNGKMVISIKIRNFSRFRMMKGTSPLEISREIYLPRRISSNSETIKISRFLRQRGYCGTLAHFEWLTVCHVSGADLVKQGEPSGAHVDM